MVKGPRDFRQLNVWERSHALVCEVYPATGGFPRGEQFGLTSQLRRAAVSIPTNIAEGCGRGGERELGRFMQIARGSVSEVDYLCLLARDLGMLDVDRADALISEAGEIGRMLTAYMSRLSS